MIKFILFLFFPIATIYCQPAKTVNFSISGAVMDSVEQSPIQFASISLCKMGKKQVLSSTTSNINGEFQFTNIKKSVYDIRINIVGYNEVIIDSIGFKNKSNINLGLLFLSPKTIVTNAVSIVSNRLKYEHYEDKDIVNVSKIPGAEAGSIIDVLKKTPLIKVDNSNNVNLLGKEDVTILVDEKPIIGDKNTLSQMPASSVEKIEIITNPSAKYDPEGQVGIINIISKKIIKDSYNGRISGNIASNKKYNGSAAYNYKSGSINLYGDYGYFSNKVENENEIIDAQDISTHSSHGNTASKRKSHMVKLGLDYDLNSSNYLSILAGFLPANSSEDRVNYYNEYDNSNKLISLYDIRSYREIKDYGNQYSLFYKKKFSDEGHEITTDMFYAVNGYTSDKSLNQYNTVPGISNDLTKNNLDVDNNLGVLKIDYIYPGGSWGKILSGYRFSNRNRKINNYVENYLENTWKNNLSLSNIFEYYENINAVYLIYAHQYYNINFQFGLRTEYTFYRGKQITSDSSFSNSYISFFPNISLKRQINESNILRLSYSRRIKRPYMEALNPFKEFNNNFSYATGNPKLKESYSDNYELTYNLYFKDNSMTFKTYLANVKNLPWTATVLEKDNIFKTSWMNMANLRNTGFGIFGSIQLSEWLNISPTIIYNSNRYSGHFEQEDLSQNSNEWYSEMTFEMNLGKGAILSLTSSYQPSVRTNIYYKNEQLNTSINLHKSFFNDKLACSLNIENIFNYNLDEFNYYGMKFSSNYKNKLMNSRNISLNISYNINSFNDREEREIDDGRNQR